MLSYTKTPNRIVETPFGDIADFTLQELIKNIDKQVIESFGQEWQKFNHFSKDSIEKIGKNYFDIINFNYLDPKKSIILDVGCGTGRWSKYFVDRVKFIEAIDPSDAVISAIKLTQDADNIRITKAGVDFIPFPDDTFDLVMSIGVLHHISDTAKALKQIVKKIKPGGYFYGYLYYRFDNRGYLFKSIFKASNFIRIIISSMPSVLKRLLCDLIAFTIYLPIITFVRLVKSLFPKRNFFKKIPLAYYVNKSLPIIRNDALDRFGTKLEKRYTQVEILALMNKSGLTDVMFSEQEPYWHFIAKKQQ